MPKIINYLHETGLSGYALDFLEASKLRSYEMMEYGTRLTNIMSNSYFMDHIINHTSELGCFDTVDLPPSAMLPEAMGLAKLNQQRRSTRDYSSDGLTLEELAQLLRLAYTVTDSTTPQRGLPPTRNIASGGGLYPNDLYYVSRNTVGLASGVYHYHLTNETLERLPGLDDSAELEKRLNAAFFADQKMDMNYANVSGYLVLGGVLNRVCFKYLDRGLRFALLDAGALTHSIHLASAAVGVGCCSMGSYSDDLTNELIGFRGVAHQTLGVVVLGKLV